MKKTLLIIASLFTSSQVGAVTEKAVLEHYADLANAMYSDSLATARHLQAAIDTLVRKPTVKNLKAAKEAWVDARHPYQQTEAYRFGNAIVDNWEGKVNAWPLDEGLIDYVSTGYGRESDENPLYTANIIANKNIMIAGKQIDTSNITKEFLSSTLHEAGEVESNVATGYHAIEFLLWGQDLNGTGKGAGNRPVTDFDPENCSWGNCERRAAYLKAVTALLVDDLAWMTDQWAEGGTARTAVVEGNLKENIAAIFTGMGSLSYGELAGERMKLGLLLHDPEEEHDCFSDNTHWSHFNNALGIRNVYTGNYTSTSGEVVKGPSLSDLVASADSSADQQLRDDLNATLEKMQVIVDSAKSGESYDQLIGERNASGNAKVKSAIEALVTQTRSIEQAVNVMGLEKIAFEGSDSLDAPHKVE